MSQITHIYKMIYILVTSNKILLRHQQQRFKLEKQTSRRFSPPLTYIKMKFINKYTMHIFFISYRKNSFLQRALSQAAAIKI